MRINTRLKIATLVPAVMTLVIGATIVFAFQAIARIQSHSQTIRNVIIGTDELTNLAAEFVIFHEERPKEQYFTEHAAVMRSFSSVRLQDPEQQRLLGSARSNTQAMRNLFVRISENVERLQRDPGNPELGAIEDRLAGRLIVKSRQAMADELLLERTVRAEIVVLEEAAAMLVILIIIAVAAGLTVVLSRTRRIISLSLATLDQGTKAVGSGDLNYSIPIVADDELGDLSREFNGMTAGLRDVTASRAELEREIAGREKAESDLRTIHRIADMSLSLTDIKAIAEGFVEIMADKTDTDGIFVALSEGVQTERLIAASGGARNLKRLGDVGAPAQFPLKAGEEKIGTVGFTWPAPRTLDENEIGFYQAAAAELALGLAQARAKQAIESELEISNLLLGAAEALATELELDKVLEALLDSAMALTGRRRGYITFRETPAEQVVAVARGPGSVPAGLRGRFDEMTSHAKKALIEKTMVIADIRDPKMTAAEKKRLASFDMERVMLMPIILGADAVALISLDDPGERREFTDREIQLVEGIAAQAAVAINRTRMYAAEAAGRRFSDALNEINAVVAASLRVGEIMGAVVQKATEAIGAERGVVYLREENEWVARYAHGFPPKLSGQRFSDAEAPFVVAAAREGRPIVSTDSAYDEHLSCKLMVDYGIKALLCTPLSLRGEIYGAILFTHHKAPAEFTDSQVDFTRKLSVGVSLALENARRLQAERRVSSTLQDALLTIAEELPGVETGHVYRSATTEDGEVGGDFYDLFELEHGRIGIVIGDVGGKGLEAATLTALVKNTIRAYAYQTFVPASVLSMTNKAISKRAAADRTFVTVFFGVLNTTSGVLRYCAAGHPPPILKATASTLPLETGSPAIGVFPDLEFSEQRKVFHPGETLVLYTDGVIEARRDGDLFGEERLTKLIADLKPAGAKKIAETIHERVLDFSGGVLEDDTAILTVTLK